MSDETSNIDRALSLVVSKINDLEERHNEGAGITLTVQGLVISGRIIPEWQWFEDLPHGGAADAHVVAESNDPGGESEGPVLNSGKDESGEVARAEYIHLCDARFFLAGDAAPIPTTGGTHWRGKLADVSGWSLGMLTVSDHDQGRAA